MYAVTVEKIHRIVDFINLDRQVKDGRDFGVVVVYVVVEVLVDKDSI